MPKDNWLFCRFGGLGDAMILTVVAKAIKQKFPDDTIDFAVRWQEQVDIFKNLPIFRKVFEIQRLPHPMQGANVVKCPDGWELLEKRKNEYSIVMDYVNSVENNSMNPQLANRYGEWMMSQNSNFQNWIDLSLGWARIDPTKVEDKSPMYIVERNERRWAQRILKPYPRPIIGVNMFASSRARSHFHYGPIVMALLKEFEGCTVLSWQDAKWTVHRKGGQKSLSDGNMSIRESAALVDQMDCLVAADSGMSHIAEAVRTENVTVYTTVPAWTRSKYYKHSHDIDIELECKPCFTLNYQCPVNRRRAMEGLSDREKEIMGMASQNIPIQQASHQLATTPDKLAQEHQSIQSRVDAVSSVIPDCIASVTGEMIVEKVKEILCGGMKNGEKVDK
jgi:ADP-heptose:LPS heptosyltransferase